MSKERVDWKNGLKLAFEIPEARPDSEKKKNFIRTLPSPRMRIWEFAFTQAGYIRPWVWCIAGVVFVVALTGTVISRTDMVWAISAMTPVLALTILTESGRSECYRMSELEMATRFSLKAMVLARLGILGAVDCVLLTFLMLLAVRSCSTGVILAGVSVVFPFLLTTCAGLWIVRRFRGREAMYICVGIASFVSIFSLVFQSNLDIRIVELFRVTEWWIAGTVILAVGTARQFTMFINGMEELSWN